MTTGGIIVYISITPQRKAQNVKERQCFPRGKRLFVRFFFEKKNRGGIDTGCKKY